MLIYLRHFCVQLEFGLGCESQEHNLMNYYIQLGRMQYYYVMFNED